MSYEGNQEINKVCVFETLLFFLKPSIFSENLLTVPTVTQNIALASFLLLFNENVNVKLQMQLSKASPR